jgi:hypothetical protein
LLKQSMAQRGRVVPIVDTCPTYDDWALLVEGVPTIAGQWEQVLRVGYPQPTPLTIQTSITVAEGRVNGSFARKLFGFPVSPNIPPHVPVLGYTFAVGTILVEWIVAGASFSVMLDLGAQSISIPACDQITVSYTAFQIGGASIGDLNVSVVPGLTAFAAGTLTRVPMVVPAGTATTQFARQGFARRWKVSVAEEPLSFPLPGPVGPVVVRVMDTPTIGDSAESVNFSDFTATAGVPASQQGWIECSGVASGYNIANLGPTDIKAKLVEQIQVA